MKYKLQLIKDKKKSTRGIRTREVKNTRNRPNHRLDHGGKHTEVAILRIVNATTSLH